MSKRFFLYLEVLKLTPGLRERPRPLLYQTFDGEEEARQAYSALEEELLSAGWHHDARVGPTTTGGLLAYAGLVREGEAALLVLGREA